MRAVLLAAALVLASASAASAAPVPVTGLSWVLEVNLNFEQQMTYNCDIVQGLQWQYAAPRHAKRRAYGTAPLVDAGSGSFDPSSHSGKASGKHEAIIFDAVFSSQGSGGRTFKIVDMGVEAAPKRVYLTGRIVPTKSRASAAKRQRLFVITRPRYSEGQVISVPGAAPLTNSYEFRIKGSAAIAAPLAKALSRARCTSKRFAAPQTRPIRAGTVFGPAAVALRPGRATGLAGRSFLGGAGFDITGDDGEVAVAPIAPAAKTRVRTASYLRFDIAAGVHVPLACEFGVACVPAGGSVPLVGGVTLSYGGRSATLGDLVASYAADPAALGPLITGTLDGAPVTVSTNGSSLSDEFASRLGTTLGTEVFGSVAKIESIFTTTGPG